MHLDRQETFSFNKETQLFPVAGLIAAELERQEGSRKQEEVENAPDNTREVGPLKAITQRHHPHIVKLIAAATQSNAEDVVDFEMLLYDTQKACLGGLMDEFIFSARLDNLNQTFCATTGLIDSLKDESVLKDETSIRMIACFDHEEIGSMTAQGAFSTMLPAIVRRLCVLPASTLEDNSDKSYDRLSDNELSTTYEQTLSSSFLISADMAHSVNPNHGAKYENDHRPEMNKGPVIKINANARYATNSPGIVLLQEVARKASDGCKEPSVLPLQLFVMRNDLSCGTTIGPMLSAHLGARTLDLGNAQLSMHSCRETCGSADVHHATRLFSAFFNNYSALESTIMVD